MSLGDRRPRAWCRAALALFVVSLSLEQDHAFAADRPQTAAPSRAERVRDALRGDALAAFDRGSALFADGDVAGARAEFMRAHALSGDPRILYNVAVCDKAQRRYARALAALHQSLDEGGGALSARYVQTVSDTAALLAPLVTTLAIRVDEKDAIVTLDDEPIGTSPIVAPIAIDIGEHVVAARKSGFHDFRERISATAAPGALTIALDPLQSRGTLSIKAHGLPPLAAAVAVVDGADVGPVPWSGAVSAGSHTIGIRTPGFTARTIARDVLPKVTTEVDLEMTPEHHDGRLRVTADDADIFVDGKQVGHGQFDGVVRAGEHTLQIARAGNVESSSDIVVREGETRSMSIQRAKSSEVPLWIWIAGGVVVAGGVTAGALLLTQKTQYEGKTVGTLPPGVVPATFRFGGL